jgi:hypothetical protein
MENEQIMNKIKKGRKEGKKEDNAVRLPLNIASELEPC